MMPSAAVFLLLAIATSVTACTQNYTNKASTPILLCSRDTMIDNGTPGARAFKLLQPGESFSEDCQVNKPYESHSMFFATRNTTKCQKDSGCTYGTCQHYPWWFGQGISQQNGLWYGGIGVNWDGDDTKHGWDGSYDAANVHYGIQFHCETNKGKNTIDYNCTVMGGKPQCTPNVPAPHNSPNSGVAQCDPTTIQLNIVEAPKGA